MKNKIVNFILFVIILENIKTGYVEVIDKNEKTKYNNWNYLKVYKIPNSMMDIKSNGDEMYNHDLLYAFDEDFETFWESFDYQKDTFLNNIIITFSKTITFNRIVYKAPTINDIEGVGYPNLLNIYYKIRKPDGSLSESESDFLLIDNIISETTDNTVVFNLNEEVICDQIKLEWSIIEQSVNINFFWATASKIMLLIPENEKLNKLIDLFHNNDYTYLNVNEEYYEQIFDIEQELEDYINTYDHIKEMVDRAEKIINGELKFEKRREFTTNQKASMNVIYQYGDVRRYSRNVLKMKRGGTNRQCTGIYGFSGDNITIYVQAKKDNNLPSIRFSQYIGKSTNFLSNLFKLKKGKNILQIPNFDISEISVNIKSGGPLYIENIYTEEEQSQDIKIYIENGILFPLFRINDNEEEFKNILSQYILDYNNNLDSYYNIMELYSKRITITLNATFGDEIYNIQGESPQKNLLIWDEIMKYFYIFDGIQFEKNEPYYDPKNEYINIHIRYSVPVLGSTAFSSNEHIGIFYKDIFKFSLLSYIEIGKTLSHEVGHMIDLNERELAERTNVVLEEYAIQTIYKNIYHRDNIERLHEDIAPDNIDNLKRFCGSRHECKGFFINTNGYVYTHYTWWAIESFNPGYWGKLDNLYRYNSSLISLMNKNEAMVFLTSLIVGFDMGYYFERFGLAMDNIKIFNNSEVSQKYKESMEKAINEGLIKTNIYKKYWYADSEQYNYTLNNGKGCYKNNNNYKIEIKEIKKDSLKGIYNITLPLINCEGHLGFEIIENDIIIGFSNKLFFIDKNEYPENYNPKYKIVAYDRLLDYKESNYKNYNEI